MPVAVGLKTIAVAHWLPDVRVDPQELEEIEKSPALVPEIATLLIVMVEAVVLESVADCEALADPTIVDAKVRLEGVAEMLVEPAPVPERVTDWGLLLALSVN